MPVTLTVRTSATSQDAASSLTFDGTRIVVGRGSGSDLRLPDPSVSHRHASIRLHGGDTVLVDEGSTNGTYLAGKRLNPHTPETIKSGDLIRVGRVWIEVSIGQSAPTHDLNLATKELAMRLVSGALMELGQDSVPVVSVAEGADVGTELRLEEDARVYVLGRGDTCDLPLYDKDASREHVHIVKRGSAILVRDLGSKNGSYLGGVRMEPDRDLPWKLHQDLQIGQTVLALHEPLTRALSEIEELPDEAIPETEAVPKAPPSLSELAEQAEQQGAAVGEIAEAVAPAPIARPAKRRHAWTPTDIAVIFAAISTIVLSIVGLAWLFKR